MTTTSHHVHVAVMAPIEQAYTYAVPSNDVAPGTRVWVPLGPRSVMGWVVGKAAPSDSNTLRIKPATLLDDPMPVFDALQLQLARWMHQYYLHPLGEVLAMMSPAALARKQTTMALDALDEVQVTDLGRTPSACRRASPKQAKLLKWLQTEADACHTMTSCRLAGFSKPTLTACLQRQWLKRVAQSSSIKPVPTVPVDLTPAQATATAQLVAALGQFSQHVLEGVTGSGKTEVYCAAIQAVLRRGEQALVLVPEIGLTPQTVSRFVARCGVKAVVYHSKLTDQEKLHAWLMAKTGRARLVIGTRSALFMPLDNLGMIVVDESHDASFKQQSGCCYSARDVAMKWAQLNAAPIVIGTATPTLETLRCLEAKRYQHHVLPSQAVIERHARVTMVEMRGQALQEGVVTRLQQDMLKHLQAGHQVLLFLNRRGFAPVLLCHHCGWSGDCERCDTHMVLHQHPKQLRCHQCNHQQPVPESCPACGASSWVHVGLGTQRLEALMQKWFPQYACVRIDRDAVRTQDRLHQALSEIHAGEHNIIIGTQMIAKGHDFKRVAMVAILDCDSHLFHPDFRATERLAQILVQVAGRAGRHRSEAHIWIQSHHIDHPVFSVLSEAGYDTWARSTLQQRQQCALPPYWHMGIVHFHAHNPNKLMALPTVLADVLAPLHTMNDLTVVGPLPSLWPKRKGYWRHTLTLSGPTRASLHGALKHIQQSFQALPYLRGIQWRIEVDPWNLG